jgi:hypothetical protein
MCLNFEIKQNSCKQIILKDYSVYDLSKGNITSVKLYILVPGQTVPKINNIPFGEEIVLNSVNMGLSNSTENLQDILEGYYEFKIEVTQTLNNNSTVSKKEFCYFNTCTTDCIIDKQTLDILSKACCDDNDCSNKLSANTKQIETLKLYREGLKAAASQCKREYADELFKCLKSKISNLDDKCDCN